MAEAVEIQAPADRIRAVKANHSEYPKRLDDLGPRKPGTIHLAGPWDHEGPVIAIVGTRDATDDARDAAFALAGALARRGVAIVSGLARGIDAAAHEGALQANGRTGAVLGTPLHRVYPPEHALLQSRVRGSLGLMSELEPGRHASKATFATRNRILAALADAVVVVEAPRGSGALLTAEAARAIGRPVGALPWDSREERARGGHDLIRDHEAELVGDVADVLKLAGLAAVSEASRATTREPLDLPPGERALYGALRTRPLPMEDLARASGLTAAELSVALVALELGGFARREPGGRARRVRRA